MSQTPPLLAALAALTALAALGRAMPSHLQHYTPRSVELSTALNRTVCPIVVDVDVDEARVPRRIKMLRCAPDPNRWCMEQKIPQHECCSHNHNNHLMECVEIHDTVLVKYGESTDSFDVAVGCSCMVGQSSTAATVDSGP